MKEKEMRLVEEHHVIQEEGWVKLSPHLLESLGIKTGDMISFLADEQGFRVKGGKKPPYFHASTEKPPTTPIPPKTEALAPPKPIAEISQMNLFGPGQSTPMQRRKR